MYRYAQIDVETGRCVGVSFLSGEVEAEHMILLGEDDEVNPGDTWDGETWTPAPQPEPPEPRQAKIDQLNAACNADILAGFVSFALGEPHEYDFDYEAQINLAGMLQAINNEMVTEPVMWKASGDPQPHTFLQFKVLFSDGLMHKNSKIQRYWMLKAQVLAAETQDDYDAIEW